MPRRLALLSTSAVLVVSSVSVATADPGSATGRVAAGVACLPGARTLSHHGDHVYPDMGNGGYRSLHTEVHLVYDAPSNRFLRGNHVVLTDRATQCLSELQPRLRADLRARTAAAPT